MESPDWRAEPQRPSIPPVFAFGIFLWAACAISYAGLREVDSQTCISMGIISLSLTIALLGWSLKAGQWRVATLCLAGLLLGVSLGSIDAWWVKDSTARFAQAFAGEALVVFEEDSASTPYGERALATVSCSSARSRAIVYLSSESTFLRGDCIRVQANHKLPADSIDEYKWSIGCSASLSVSS